MMVGIGRAAAIAALVLVCILNQFTWLKFEWNVREGAGDAGLRRQLSLEDYLAMKNKGKKIITKTVKPEVDEETAQRHRKSFLGGLFPQTDHNMIPIYLRDAQPKVRYLDILMPTRAQKDDDQKGDLVFFWHIPKASGSTIKNVMNFCFDLRRAEKTEAKASLEFVRDGVLNMDTATPEGLRHSFEEELVDSGMVDVIISNYFLAGSALFNERHYGNAFTVFRHPIYQAQSLFYYRRKAKWERSYRKELMHITFETYISNPAYVDNWMTRQLTNSIPSVELTEADLERAILIMRKKIFVGIQEQMEETMRQLVAHFGWNETDKGCASALIKDRSNANEYPNLSGGRGGSTWNIAAEVEKWDLQLYDAALKQFAEQGEIYPAGPAPENGGASNEPYQTVASTVWSR